MTSAGTRTRIVEVATRLFHEQGYHATGIATILREAQVRSGSLYHFFDGKEGLLRAVLQRYLELLQPVVLRPAEEATDDPIERVFALLAWYRSGLQLHGCTQGCPIGNLALELGDGHPEVRELIDANFRGWSAGVRGWLEEAGDALPAGLDRGDLADMILTLMEGAIMRSRAAGSLEPFDQVVAQLRDYLARLSPR